MTQTTIFDYMAKINKERLPKDKLITLEHEILNMIKFRNISTEEIMEKYELSRVQVRNHIKRIRRLKPGNTMIMNVRVEFEGQLCYGYGVVGDDLLFKRWKSSTETAIKNNPFLLEKMYRHLNDMKALIDRPAEKQIKAQLNPSYKPHDVTYTSYEKKGVSE